MSEPLQRCLRIERTATAFSPWALAAACEDQPYAALLENPGVPSDFGRYAWFCTDPFLVFRSARGRCHAGPPGDLAPVEGAPLAMLETLLRRYGAGPVDEPTREGLPPFVGGAVGTLGYELLYEIEDQPGLIGERADDDLALPDCTLMFCDLVFAADLLTRSSWIFATGFGEDAATAAARADARLEAGRALLARLDERSPSSPLPWRELAGAARAAWPRLREADLPTHGVQATVDREGYLAAITEIQQEIQAGKVFEVCLTQRFDASLPPTLADGRGLYEILRAINPAPMSAYLRLPEAELLSASPERFLSLDPEGHVETRPIKGTRPRGRNDDEDRALRDDLLTAEKDRAENLMIVDLCRNDLGKVCRFGSVRVGELCGVHPYEFTWQMVSTIHGRLRPSLGPIDLLRACFPGGSMTGAPKVEAMKIINRLEPRVRGAFSGAIGFFDFGGAVDLSIVIRTIVCMNDRRLSFHVGGAIVADSVPAEEYQETLDKAHALVLAIELAARAGEVR